MVSGATKETLALNNGKRQKGLNRELRLGRLGHDGGIGKLTGKAACPSTPRITTRRVRWWSGTQHTTRADAGVDGMADQPHASETDPEKATGYRVAGKTQYAAFSNEGFQFLMERERDGAAANA